MAVESFDPQAPTPGVRLSRREMIKSIIASGAVVSAGSLLGLAGCAPGETNVATGGVERLISLNVNGKTRRVDVLPQETLANTLRHKLGLTGTKLGCDRGECGACTILVDDTPGLFLLDAHPQRAWSAGDDGRRPAGSGRYAASGATGLC